MSDERKDLPPVGAPNFLEKLRETVQIYLGNRGDKLDRGLILRDLTEANIIALSKGFLAGGRGSPVAGPGSALADPYEIDLTPPPTPTGFTVSAAISNIFIECAAQTYLQGHGHAKTVVYGATRASGAPLPVFTDAVPITEFGGTVFAHPTNPATTWHLWIKWVTVDGVESAAPAGGTNGQVAITGQDVSKMVAAMTGPGNPFTVLEVDTVIGGITFPAGTYSTQAFIRDLQVTNAKIANLAVDDAKIANLAVSKLTAGSLAVGQYAQSTGYVANTSGWRINGDGTAEFSGVVVRGTVYASAGQIGGNTIDATGMQSPGYTAGSTGWRLDSGGLLRAFASGGTRVLDMAATGASAILKAGAVSVLADGSMTLGSNFSIDTGGGIAMRGSIRGGGYAGYGWPAAGQTGFYLGPEGALFGNFNDAKYFQLTAAGDMYAPGMSVVGGILTISRANVINTLNLAGNSVSVGAGASGTAATISCNLTIPPNETMRIQAAGFATGGSGPLPVPSAAIDLYIDGALQSSALAFSFYVAADAESGQPAYYGMPSTSAGGALAVAGGTGGRTVTISLTGAAGAPKTLNVQGFLR